MFLTLVYSQNSLNMSPDFLIMRCKICNCRLVLNSYESIELENCFLITSKMSVRIWKIGILQTYIFMDHIVERNEFTLV